MSKPSNDRLLQENLNNLGRWLRAATTAPTGPAAMVLGLGIDLRTAGLHVMLSAGITKEHALDVLRRAVEPLETGDTIHASKLGGVERN